ncbi:Reverse transcriptase domain [Arabidopsis suecica]|uniref:Reverse transcriptase domain n=1 Tax=Arabidopsis suecica TaxID=45249 RepID=A0A8T2BAL8_ARASU|nr:Reverse transcriptase domain [Arabidopsis suecica]
MSAAMDKALMAMSLEDDDVPFVMPDLPEFSSCERNVLSLIGRILNPECQTVSGVVHSMPRKWQKTGRTRGIALSKERFQFIFKNEYDLVEVLQKGFQTYNEWGIVIERWSEVPPPDSLQFVPIWVQIRNIPVNYYTELAIGSLGDIVGQVIEVAFDPTRAQVEDHVRVHVKFDVSKPLRKSKIISLPKNKSSEIFFFYERVQKRCYNCQRLSHERDVCPILVNAREAAAVDRRLGIKVPRPPQKKLILSEADPLFGVLNEDQVGLHPVSGRPKIAQDVIEGMRQYLLVDNGEDRKVKEDRVRKSVREAEKSPITQKLVLSLEPVPLITHDLEKGKGLVFGYSSDDSTTKTDPVFQQSKFLKGSSFPSAGVNRCVSQTCSVSSVGGPGEGFAESIHFPISGNNFKVGVSQAGPSTGFIKKTKQRKRKSKSSRKASGRGKDICSEDVVMKQGAVSGTLEKRKAKDDLEGVSSAGMGRPQDLTIPRLMELRKKHFPEVLFLMETMNCKNVIVDIQVWLGYDHVYTVDPVGTCGGLAVFWKNSVDIEVKFADKNVLDLFVQLGSNNFFVSCVYGNPNASLRHEVWERLTRIGATRKESWCMLGDFNEILNNSEKIGGPRRSESTFKPFSTMLSDCGMTELSSFGNSFTWGGRRQTLWIQCKLDRCFGNKNWSKMFPASNQSFLVKRGSDHRPVLVSLVSSQASYKGSFRFDKRMLHKPLVKESIVAAWNSATNSLDDGVSTRLRKCRKALSKWKKDNDLNSKVKINAIEEELETVQSSACPSAVRLTHLKNKLVDAYREEESFWQQKSRATWMHSGDKNTKFFHASVNNTRSKNGLTKLLDDNGITHKSEASKGDVAASYFQKLFTSSDPTNPLDLLEGFEARVTDEMNDQLVGKVTKEEVKSAVFSIKPSSAPGADGMTGLFFQQYWDVIGDQVFKEVARFFEVGVFPREWNFTQLCLIPKKVNSPLMSDLRPISLCSVLYKVVSKILVSRLQPLLPGIISPNQSAFVPERLISDNILIAHEAVHALRTHPAISKEFMAVKTDMSKAYDRMEWSYLKAILTALGFCQKWVDLVMYCVTSVSYTVLINGQPFGLINPERGIRQGDPLSPSLFVLCAEGLTHLLNRAEADGVINGIQFSESGPAIHHLLFADDSLFLFKADEDQAEAVQSILSVYGKVTGQLINLEKSSISFGENVNLLIKGKIQGLLGIFSEGGSGSYLGLPECFSGSKVDLLAYIHDKLKARMSGWFARTLSQGGKEVLLKAVAMAMPVYAMSCFKLPKTTCDNLSAAMAAFWWDSIEDKRKMHWIGWDKLCVPKHFGGLGFKDIQVFNQALLAKQAWRIMHDKESLFARFIKSRYFDDSTFLQAFLGGRPSFAWRSILHGRDLLRMGLRRMIGDGASSFVWTDQWVLDGVMRPPLMKNIIFDLNLRVSDLLDPINGSWDLDSLQEHFFPGDVELILKLKPVRSSEDFFIWEHTKSGEYSVKSGYWLAFQRQKAELLREMQVQPSFQPIKDQIWKCITPTKIKNFLWKVVSGAIPVVDKMMRRGLKVDSRCQSCGGEGESANHVLFTCSVARQTWALSNFPVPVNGFDSYSIYHNLFYLFLTAKNNLVPLEVRRSFPWILWQLWKNRNLFFFEGKRFVITETVAKILDDANQWFFAQALDNRELLNANSVIDAVKVKWSPPPHEWLKCNMGSSWDRIGNIGGAAWVLRDENGEVLCHGRRSFAFVGSKLEASVMCWQWVFESMKSLRVDKIIFASEDFDLIGAVLRPSAWPSYKFQSLLLIEELGNFLDWNLCGELRISNLGAHLIAKSVTVEDRRQSYVATGFPFWLKKLFEDESSIALCNTHVG